MKGIIDRLAAAGIDRLLAGGLDRLPPGARRLVWFLLLWLAGVAAVGAVAMTIRYWLGQG